MMQDSTTMGWSAHGRGGAVAAGQPEAVSAGILTLREGGNAVDGAIAVILALSVSDFGRFAFGGEISFMLYNASGGEIRVLSGLGAAPRSTEAMRWYGEHGIPCTGDIKAAAPPAVLDLCTAALAAYGTCSFERVVEPTLELLHNGTESWHKPLLETLQKLVETERASVGSRAGKLRHIRDRFYRGDLAAALAAYYAANGSFLSKADLASHRTLIETAVSIPYRGHTVYKCGPWTQGPSLCQALRLLEAFDLHNMGHLSADCIHVVVEALKLAFADRDAYYADPRFADVPLEALLSTAYTDLRRECIDMAHASHQFRPGDPRAMRAVCSLPNENRWSGGTTTCVVSDRFGNVVAATPSANQPYHVCEELGVAHGNRLRCLNTTPGHPNRVQPGKRPRITLTPTLVVEADGSILAMSVAGGDMQEQTTLNCLVNHLDFRMLPEEAVSAPRFSTNHHENSFRSDANRMDTTGPPASLSVNRGIAESTFAVLKDRGHQVRWADTPIARPVMLYLQAATGISYVAGDRKAGRYAQAID